MSRLTPNRAKDITPYVNPSPIGQDVPCTAIQKSMQSVVQKSFGRAVSDGKGNDNDVIIYPAVFAGDGKDMYNPLEHLDNFHSIGLCVVNNPHEYAYDNPQRQKVTYDIDVIVWINLNKMNTSLVGDYSPLIIQSTVNSIARSYDGIGINEVVTGFEDTFTNYDFNTQKHKLSKYPYSCFRVNCEAVNVESC